MKRVLVVIMALCLGFAPVVWAGDGQLLYEEWTGIGGTVVTDLTGNANYPDNPDITLMVTELDRPNGGDAHNDYGARITGYIMPPQSGDWNFWVAGDDQTQLWLSPNGDPAAAVLIAQESGWSDYRAFDGDAERASAPQRLYANRKYYIMGIFKEGTGGDHISAAWRGPGIDPRAIIGGSHVTTIGPVANFVTTSPDPANNTIEVSPDTDLLLSWSAPVNASPSPIIRYDVYFSANDIQVGDPNSGLARLGSVTPDQPLQWTIPAAQLDFNTNYAWRVDAMINTNIGDPNNALGDVWRVQTKRTAPVITSQPSGKWAWPGETVTFAVAATGDPLGGAINYQWHFNGNAIPGETGTTLILTGVDAADAGNYHCAVSNNAGSVPSATVSLGIKELLAWYKLDDAATTEDPNLVDSSGNNRHGQIIGNVTSAEGRVGKALNFDGGYARTPFLAADMNLDGNKPRTVTAWINTRGFGNGGIYDVGNRGDGQNFSLRTLDNVANRWRVQYWGGDYDFTTSGAGNGKNVGSYEALTLNTWAHFAHTHDGTHTKIYLNGRLIVNWARVIDTGSNFTFRIGRYGPDDTGSNFVGTIDDVQIYNYPMDETEVALMYTDIMLNEMVCVGGNPQWDLNGNCRVDLGDLMLLASQWLECNLVPDCKP
ncbi:MAG: immunoglobulin domain-containing protein [Phycisphaerae bacterium]|nr:immunoglobulin domain-containing protein [Phycisphaerae bacterium]